MNPLASMGLAAARREASRRASNIARRVARLEAKGIETNAMLDLSTLSKVPSRETRNEAVKRLNLLRKLDASPGTRDATAAHVAAREATANRRAAAAERLIGRDRTLPAAQDVDDLNRALRRSVGANVRRVKASEFKSTPATEAFDRLMEESNPNMSRRAKARETRRLVEISRYQGTRLSGAREQHERGVAAFGDAYNTWTPEQRSAAWQGFRDLADREASSLSSSEVLATVSSAATDGTLKVSFYSATVSDGLGGTRTEVRSAVDRDQASASREASLKEYRDQRFAEMLKASRRPII